MQHTMRMNGGGGEEIRKGDRGMAESKHRTPRERTGVYRREKMSGGGAGGVWGYMHGMGGKGVMKAKLGTTKIGVEGGNEELSERRAGRTGRVKSCSSTRRTWWYKHEVWRDAREGWLSGRHVDGGRGGRVGRKAGINKRCRGMRGEPVGTRGGAEVRREGRWERDAMAAS